MDRVKARYRVRFRTDRMTFVGATVTDVVRAMMAQSHDCLTDEREYMARVSDRCQKAFGIPIRHSSAWEFLNDIEVAGKGRLMKEIL